MSVNKINLYNNKVNNSNNNLLENDFDKDSIKTKDDLKTGDLILCAGGDGDSKLDKLIEFATHSPWEHSVMVIKDPWWCEQQLYGLYVFQSGTGPNGYKDILNGNVTGVTLNRLGDFLANRHRIYVKSLENYVFDQEKKDNFVKAFKKSHGKPYDSNIYSWIGTGINAFFCNMCKCCATESTPRTTKTFWCSALVAFMYVKMGVYNKNLDWSCQTPENLDVSKCEEPYSFSKLWLLKK